MKRLMGIAALIASVAVGTVFAQYRTPDTRDGRSISPADAPCIPFSIGASTPANTNIVVRTQPSYLSWVKFSTSTYEDFTMLKDTGSLNHQTSVSTFYLTGGSATVNQSWDFNPPMYLANGLLANHSNAAVWVTGCSRRVDQQTP